MQERRFKEGSVIYSAKSDGKGGAIIIYHTVKGLALVDGMSQELVEGEMKKIPAQIPSVNTDQMEANVYLPESNFFTLEELPKEIMNYMNKKMLY